MNASTATAEKKVTMEEISAQIERESKEAEAWGQAEGYALRGLKVAKYLSEETTAFASDITKNGKVVGYAKNDGHGGSTLVEVKDLDYKFYGMLETWVDMLVERAEEEKWIASQTKSMAKKGVDLVMFIRTGRSATAVVGDYGNKSVAVAKATKEYGKAPFKVVDLSATSAKVRQEADTLRNAKWKAKVKAEMKSKGAVAVVFMTNEKGGTSCKGFRDTASAEAHAAIVKSQKPEVVKL